jgi:uncharacterized phage protein (TIGR02216 family)
MSTGLGDLGLPPDQFWRTTPREFAAAVRGRFGLTATTPPPLTSSALVDLMRAHPDIRP